MTAEEEEEEGGRWGCMSVGTCTPTTDMLGQTYTQKIRPHRNELRD